MNVPLKAVAIGLALAALIAFCHLLFPVLLVVLMLGLIRRVWFGAHWAFSRDGYGHGSGWGAMRYGAGACGSLRIPTIDGSPWQRSNRFATSTHDVQSI